MSTTNSTNPTLDGIWFKPQVLTAMPTGHLDNGIAPSVKVVEVVGVHADADDWVTLPDIAQVPVGHEITILNNAASNFELRTPAASNTKINGVDADGSQEYLCTDTEIVKVIKMSDSAGWHAHDYTAVGAVVAAHVPN